MTASASPCSVDSLDVEEPLAGTAVFARAVLVVEAPGPWGREALTESHLDRDVARELDRRVTGLPVSVLLARTPGRHADLHTTAPRRRVWAAVVDPARPRWTSWTIGDPAELLDLDIPALAAGTLPGGPDHHVPPSTLFVCGNAKRDLCCAREGRALANSLTAETDLRGRVWEVSHLGGHRFAPTAVVLPLGVVYGRLDAGSARAALESADSGELVVAHQRGLMGLVPVAQAADIEVRRRSAVLRADDVQVVEVLEGAHGGELDGWLVTVDTSDSIRWSVAVAQVNGADRRKSCGADKVAMTYHRASILSRAAIA